MSDDLNPHAMAHRKRRAEAMAAWLEEANDGMSREDMADGLQRLLPDHTWWQATAKRAGINAEEPPSLITRAMTVGLVRNPELKGLVGT